MTMNILQVIDECDAMRESQEGIGLSDTLIQIIEFAYSEGCKKRRNLPTYVERPIKKHLPREKTCELVEDFIAENNLDAWWMKGDEGYVALGICTSLPEDESVEDEEEDNV